MRSVACAGTTRSWEPGGSESRVVFWTVHVTITGAWARFSNGQMLVGYARASVAAHKHRQIPATSGEPRAVMPQSYSGQFRGSVTPRPSRSRRCRRSLPPRRGIPYRAAPSMRRPSSTEKSRTASKRRRTWVSPGLRRNSSCECLGAVLPAVLAEPHANGNHRVEIHARVVQRDDVLHRKLGWRVLFGQHQAA